MSHHFCASAKALMVGVKRKVGGIEVVENKTNCIRFSLSQCSVNPVNSNKGLY